jgi:hypothetical protein
LIVSIKGAVRANRLDLQAVARMYPNFTLEQRLAILRQIQMQRHPRGRDLTFEGWVSRFVQLLASPRTSGSTQSVASFAGNLTTVAVNSSDLLALAQQPGCSLNLDDAAFTLNLSGPVFGYTVANSTPNYQLALHNAAGLTTTPGKYPTGCGDSDVGVPSRKIVFAGTTTASVRVYASHFYNSLVGYDQIYAVTAQTNDTFQTFSILNDPNDVADLATSDLNGDGNGDLVALDNPSTNAGNADVNIFLGKADGTFSNPTAISLPGNLAIGAVIDDFNGDGHKDIVVSTEAVGGAATTYYINFLAGNGDGTFKPVASYTETPQASALVSGGGGPYYGLISADLRGSGHKDLITAAGIILFGKGDGTFTQSSTAAFTAGQATSDFGPSVIAADFNNDGIPDLATDNGDTIQVLLGNGDGTFTPKASYATIPNVGYLVAQDIDGDGNIDLYSGTGNNGSLGGDQYDFNMGYALMGNGDGTFRGAPNIQNGVYTGNNLGDVNGDGVPDIVTANSNGSFSIQLGTGKGTFSPVSSVTAPATFTLDGATFTGANTFPVGAFVVGDLNGDGKADLAFTDIGLHQTAGTQSILAVYFTALSNGDGTFPTPTPHAFPQIAPSNSFDTSVAVSGMQMSNLKKGGPAALLYTFNETGAPRTGFDPYNQGIMVIPGNGDGTFGAPVLTFTNSSTTAINFNFGPQIAAIADLNGDGNPDLVVLSNSYVFGVGAASQVEIFLGNGDGSFKAPITVNTPANATAIALADFNNDGKIDIATLCGAINAATDEIAISLGNGDGTFAAPTTMTIESDINGFASLAAADFNGDGNPDLALINPYGTSGIFFGNGDGTFTSVSNSNYVNPAAIFYLYVFGTTTAVDLTGSGKPDLLVGNTILLNLYGSTNTAQAATSTALSASASSITAGNSITFTATVTGAAGSSGTPTGTVTFMNGTTTLGTGPLSSAGVATYSTTALATGADNITAVYGGDSNFLGSTSTAVAVTVSAAPVVIATTTTIAASATSAASGTSLTFTANVTPASGNATPTGAVTFADGTTTLGTGTVGSNGTATYSTSGLAVGSHSMTAAYGGATTFSPSTSSAVTITVTAAVTPSLTLSLSPASGTVSNGSSATSTISVTPAGGFSQAVSLTCSGAPQHSTCAITPTSVTPSGTSASTATLTIATNVSTAALSRPSHPAGLRGAGGTTALAFLGGGVMLGFTLLRRRRRIWWTMQLGITLLATAVFSAVGCSGPQNTTPSGSYTITVSAASGSISQTAAYTLTVQ